MKSVLSILLALATTAIQADEPRPTLPADVMLFGYDGAIRVGRDRGIVWEYRKPEFSFVHDGWVLPDGNVMFSHAQGVVEVNAAKEIVWEFPLPRAISCQPLPGGRVLVIDEGRREMVEVERAGKAVVRRVSLAGDGLPRVTGYRLGRQSADGVTLVGCKSGRTVLAVSKEGKVTTITPPIKGDFAFSAVRQPDGDLLVTTVFDAQLVKLSPTNEPIWAFGNEQFPKPRLWGVTGTQTLPDGSYAVTNTDYHITDLALAEIIAFGVSPQKELLWTITRSDLFPQLENLFIEPETGFEEMRHTHLQVLYPGWEKDTPVR